MSQTLELIIQELQQRIGQITSDYETKLAVMKAQATEQIQLRDQKIQELISGNTTTPDSGDGN
jgi:hypothetical protein